MADERKLIERVARAIPSIQRGKGLKQGIAMGIGDDAAVIRNVRKRDWVVTVDAFVEGVHFLRGKHPADAVGYKALARATSDLAAMGARPDFFLLSLALPIDCTGRWLNQFATGMGRASRELGLVLVGGDTTRSASISISITVVGHTRSIGTKARVVPRSGARAGELLYVSGPLGQAQLGLELVLQGRANNHKLQKLLASHLYPAIRLELGEWLASRGIASAMIDISDGLSTDLGRLCSASHVGARIYEERIPVVHIPPSVARLLRPRAPDPLSMALHGGDDYELLFAAPKKWERKLAGAPGFQSLKCIGEIESRKGVRLIGPGGQARHLHAKGWDSFRKA